MANAIANDVHDITQFICLLTRLNILELKTPLDDDVKLYLMLRPIIEQGYRRYMISQYYSKDPNYPPSKR